jgi:hypothetical protein
VSDGSPLTFSLQQNGSFELETTLVAQPTPGQLQQRLNIDIRNSAGETVTVGYDWSQQKVPKAKVGKSDIRREIAH